MPQHDRGRKDYNFCNAWVKFYARYQPNKQVNLDTILKKWEALTDEDLSFSDFRGKYIKLIGEVELIGQPPTEAQRYKMSRRNVKNPSLEHIVAKLSLPDARRISPDIFFRDCNYFIQYHKEKDSGRKRKAKEVLGHVVTISKDFTSDLPPNTVCYRCGRPGHLKYNFNTKTACPSTVCSVCKAHIGTDNHNARNCSKESARVFPNAARSSKKKVVGKGRKPAATRGKSSSSSTSSKPNNNGPTYSKPAPYNTHGDAVKDLPKDVIAAMATLNRFAKARGDLERRVFSEEENSSSR